MFPIDKRNLSSVKTGIDWIPIRMFLNADELKVGGGSSILTRELNTQRDVLGVAEHSLRCAYKTHTLFPK